MLGLGKWQQGLGRDRLHFCKMRLSSEAALLNSASLNLQRAESDADKLQHLLSVSALNIGFLFNTRGHITAPPRCAQGLLEHLEWPHCSRLKNVYWMMRNRVTRLATALKMFDANGNHLKQKQPERRRRIKREADGIWQIKSSLASEVQ